MTDKANAVHQQAASLRYASKFLQGVGSISGGTLDADAKKKTGKTMEQLTEEKRKELDEKIAKGGDANIKHASPAAATSGRRIAR